MAVPKPEPSQGCLHRARSPGPALEKWLPLVDLFDLFFSLWAQQVYTCTRSDFE